MSLCPELYGTREFPEERVLRLLSETEGTRCFSGASGEGMGLK